MNAPQLYVGQESRFGGKVVKVTNLNGLTRLEIATQPLDDSARPRLGAASIGRIYADIHGFVDPIDVNNQYVTVLGNIKGTEKGEIGKASYNFVVIDVRGYQRWHLTQQVMTPPQPIDPWIWYGPTRRHPGYWGPNPYWGMNTGGRRRLRPFLPNSAKQVFLRPGRGARERAFYWARNRCAKFSDAPRNLKMPEQANWYNQLKYC